MDAERHDSSFRDPEGFVFHSNGRIYRQVCRQGAENFDLFLSSGLYEKLVSEGITVKFSEAADVKAPRPETAYKILKPEIIPFISYPYEWSFSQLKDAALLTLKIQKAALEHGMSLKDASAYNIQFTGCRPLLIDTISFEKYREGEPWSAYGQFCRHFAAPLALMAKTDIQLSKLLIDYIDGVPLQIASKLLPFSTRFNFGMLSHIHLHAKSVERFGGKKISGVKAVKMSRFGMLALIDSLESLVKGIKLKGLKTEWGGYYGFTNYTAESFEEKKKLVAGFLSKLNPAPGYVLDLGANTGVFSRIAEEKGAYTVSSDIDPAAVEANYLHGRGQEGSLLPLVVDLINPPPAIGWANAERDSFFNRAKGADCVMALALIHHLCIGNNLPFYKAAEYMAGLGKHLIIEFVPREDSQAERMLYSRRNIFPHYDAENFEKEFGMYFKILEKAAVKGSIRTMYRMERKTEV